MKSNLFVVINIACAVMLCVIGIATEQWLLAAASFGWFMAEADPL